MAQLVALLFSILMGLALQKMKKIYEESKLNDEIAYSQVASAPDLMESYFLNNSIWEPITCSFCDSNTSAAAL